MVVDNTPINVNNVLIENVPGYVYLGQHYSLKEKNQDKEIQRRIMAGWAAYAKHRDIFKSNLAICLKRQVYNSCVLPAMTYGADTWTLTKQAQNKLAAAQTNMERSMLNITYKDRRTNIWVRERTKLIDIIYTVRKMKWSWAGHINRLKDDRLIIIIIRQPLCPVVGRRPQHVVSKLSCLVLSSAISCRSSICPGRLSTAWLVSLVVLSCHMVSKRWRARSIGRLWGD